MAISYPLTFPSLGIKTMTFRARNVVGMTASPFTGQQQVYKYQGEWWEAEVAMPPMKRADAETMIAFLLSLGGRYGTFNLGDPIGTSTRGVGTGTPLVNGASQTGSSLITDGWTTETTGILKAGDWIQLGSGSTATLHKVLADVDSDASGNATIDIFPRIRTAPSDDATIVVSNTVGRWRLSSDATDYSVNEASVYGITFACIEAL